VLYIFGGGHVSIALANAASAAGFAIGVIDDRESFANPERFPMAQEIFTSFEESFEKIKPSAATYMVIVTRGHKDDMHVLRWAVGTSPRYIGMIGSKRKVLSVYRALEKEGIPLEKFASVHAPVGLDIGALTPEEIAISITAELIAVRRGVSDYPRKSVSVETATATAAVRGERSS
jgi:xanthine dehydrogenase accessory factor